MRKSCFCEIIWADLNRVKYIGMIVIKLGGSVLQDAVSIQQLMQIVLQKQNISLVVSALSTVTDLLESVSKQATAGKSANIAPIIQLHTDIAKYFGCRETIFDALFEDLSQALAMEKQFGDGRFCSAILSFGERLSSQLIAAVLSKLGRSAQALNSWDIGLVTTKEESSAKILPSSYINVKRYFKNFSTLAVITGFIGKSVDGQITTLGRGGSDLTATFLGAALEAERIELWKNVDGVFFADPKWVEHQTPLQEMTFAEAFSYGWHSKQLFHPPSFFPIWKKDIPLYVRNPCSLCKGTKIVRSSQAVLQDPYRLVSHRLVSMLLRLPKQKAIYLRSIRSFLSSEDSAIFTLNGSFVVALFSNRYEEILAPLLAKVAFEQFNNYAILKVIGDVTKAIREMTQYPYELIVAEDGQQLLLVRDVDLKEILHTLHTKLMLCCEKT